MSDDVSLVPFGTYVRLYTLHRVEHIPTLSDLILTRIRIETLRYSFEPLRALPLDSAYADDPREGAQMVRGAVLPRLYTLLDLDDPFRELGGQEVWWRRYAAERGLPTEPLRAPAIHAPGLRPQLPARSKTAERLARAQQALELARTAVETAAALAASYQNWQLGRERRRLLETQRLLLQDSIRAQLAAQDQALERGLDRGFVRGYLADHAGDTAYDAVFGDTPPESPA